MSEEPRIAVFVDFENLAIGVRDMKAGNFRIQLVLKRLLEKGRIVYKRAYCDWRNYEDTVREFLEKEQSPGKTWAEVVQYRLAIDSEDATNEAYMKAAEQSGIPTAFIVGRDAVVEWIGHPMGMDDPLAKVAAGSWDRQEAIAEFQRQQKLKQLSRELNAKFRAEEWDEALAMLDQYPVF